MALTLPTISIKNEKVGQVTLPEEIFGLKVNPALLALAVRVFLDNQRQGSRKVQTRGEVSRTKAKVWRQKGTGRARHGSRGAHIFVGGGVAHGPTGRENFAKKLTKRMRRRALLGALSLKVQENTISVVSNLDSLEAKTKALQGVLAKLTDYPKTKKVLLIIDQAHQNVIASSHNLPGIQVTQAHRINAYEVMQHQKLVFSPEAIQVLTDLYGSKASDKKTQQTVKTEAKAAQTSVKTKAATPKTKPKATPAKPKTKKAVKPVSKKTSTAAKKATK